MFKWRTRIVIFVVIIGFYIIWFALPKMIVEIHHPIIQTAKTLKGAEVNDDSFAIDEKEVCIRTKDDLKLVGTYFEALDTARASIVLIHGIRATKEDFASLIPILQQRGINVLAVDLRAHGESDGSYCTFGVHEKEDINLFVDSLNQDLPIGIWGRSLGGAVALQTLAIDDRIEFGIIESTFSSMEDICKDYFERYAGFRFDALMNFALWRSGQIADFNPAEAHPMESCSKISQAIFMAHGEEDKFISSKYARKNFEALATSNKKLELIPLAGHANIWSKGGDDFFEKLWSFVDEQIL